MRGDDQERSPSEQGGPLLLVYESCEADAVLEPQLRYPLFKLWAQSEVWSCNYQADIRDRGRHRDERFQQKVGRLDCGEPPRRTG